MTINPFKKLFAFVLVLVSAFTLASCRSLNLNVLNPDTVYAKTGKYNVTNRELYNRLRYTAGSFLYELANRQIYKEYLKKVNFSDTKIYEYAKEAILKEILGVGELKDLKKYLRTSKIKDEQILEKTTKFLDKLVLEGKVPNTNVTDLAQELTQTIREDKRLPDYLLQARDLKVAEYLFAKDQIKKDLANKRSDYYVTDKKIKNYYKSTYRYQDYTVSFLKVDLLNTKEFETIMRLFKIKRAANNVWYEIPDVNKILQEKKLDEDVNKYVKKILTDNPKIFGTVKNDGTSQLNKYQLNEFYTLYEIKESRKAEDGKADVALDSRYQKNADDKKNYDDKKEILKRFIEIYNLFQPNDKKIEISPEGKIVNKVTKEVLESTKEMKYKDFEDTGLRDYIYSLDLKDNGARRYSQDIQRKNNKNFLAYLLSSNKDQVDNEKIYNKKDDKFQNTDEAKAVQEKIRKILEEKALDDAYIKQANEKMLAKVKVHVNDNVMYAQTRTLFKNVAHKSSRTDILSFKKSSVYLNDLKTELSPISLKDFFEHVKKIIGPGAARDILGEKFILDNYQSKITDKMKKDIKKAIKSEINSFSQNQFASNKLPSSIGVYEFYIKYYNVEKYSEIYNKKILQKAIELYRLDPDVLNYETLTKRANRLFKEYANVDLAHLLAYFDTNLDGKHNEKITADTLTQEQIKTLSKLLKYAIKQAYENRVDKMYDTLDEIAKKFNSIPRLTPYDAYEKNTQTLDNKTKEKLNFGDDLKLEDLVKLRNAGVTLKAEKLNKVKNSKNDFGQSSKFDERFMRHALDFYRQLLGTKKPHEASLENPVIEYASEAQNSADFTKEQLKKLESSFGFHVLAGLSLEKAPTTEGPKDTIKRFKEKGLNLDNSKKDELTVGQIKTYFLSDFNDYRPDLPTNLVNVLNNVLKTFKEKVNNANTKKYVLEQILGNVDFGTDAHAKAMDKLNSEMNQRSFFNYEKLKPGNNDYKIYNDWFSPDLVRK